MSFVEYFDHVRQALTVQDVKGIKYKYELAQGENVTDIEVIRDLTSNLTL